MNNRAGFWCCLFLCLIWISSCDIAERIGSVERAIRNNNRVSFSVVETRKLEDLDAALDTLKVRNE
jgi:hypothetical protein